MTKKKRKKLIRLLTEETKCIVMARLGQIGWPESGDYFMKAIHLRNRIWKLLFGTSNLTDLGHKFNLPIDPPKRTKVTKKNKNLFED